MEELRLKDDLELGVASSATQVEGSDKRNSWYDWYKKGYIKDSSSPLRANDHYNLYKEDIDLMAKMGITHYRLSIEWSRIEPTKGVFNNGEIKHYRDVISYLISSGITPLVTLHHFSNPMWFENMGGFENDECVEIFLHYVKKMIESIGDIVSEYITINEPNVYAINGFFFGSWPPGKQKLKLMGKVLTNMAKCHIKAYNLIHEIRNQMGYTDTKVSYSIHMRVFEPKDEKSAYQRFAVRKTEQYFQTAVVKAMTLGECERPIKKLDLPKGVYADFIALNYYSRSTLTGFEDGVKEFAPVNDLGWEIYPEGINICAKKLYDIAPMPIYVTENGTCDNTDDFRIKFIYEHLKAMSESNLPYMRYYHWSFTDNFEWLEGESARFGLVKVDYETQKRTVKNSGEFYEDLIKNHGVTEEMTLKYTGQYYKRADKSVIDGIDDVYFDYEKTIKSEMGNSVITNVSKYAKDPTGYSEEEERIQAGLSVNKNFGEKTDIENAIDGVLTGVCKGTEEADDKTLNTLDNILNRNESEVSCDNALAENAVYNEECECDKDTSECIEETNEDTSYEDDYDSLDYETSVISDEENGDSAENDSNEETITAEEDTVITSYENDYDSLIEEYSAAKPECEKVPETEDSEETDNDEEDSEIEKAPKDISVEETPDLLDSILERVESDEARSETETDLADEVKEETVADTPELTVYENDYDSLIEEYNQALSDTEETNIEQPCQDEEISDTEVIEKEETSVLEEEQELDDDDYVGMFLN